MPTEERQKHPDLLAAVHCGDLAKVERLLVAGAAVDFENEKALTPLIVAAAFGHPDVVEKLLHWGARVDYVNKKGRTALVYASSTDDHCTDVVKKLLGSGADVNFETPSGDTPLTLAAWTNRIETIRSLIQAGANVDHQTAQRNTALCLAAMKGHVYVVEMLIFAGANLDLPNHDLMTPLIAASQGGHVNCVSLLVKAGANRQARNKHGRTAIACAKEPRITDLLLEVDDLSAMCADIFEAIEKGRLGNFLKIVDKFVLSRDLHNRTPLHVAAGCGRLDMMEKLIEMGARIASQDDDGRTALHFACSAGQEDCASFLLHNGARIEAKDWRGQTPLDVAVVNGHLNVVRMLQINGASLENVSKEGCRLLHHAVASMKIDMVKFALERGVQINAYDCRGWSALHFAISGPKKPKKVFRRQLAASPDFAVENPDLQHQLVRHSDRLAIVMRLLECQDIDVNIQDDKGSSPLMAAVVSRDVEVAAALIAKGASVDLQNSLKETPLLRACLLGDAKMVELLLKHGARADLADREDRIPLQVVEPSTELYRVVKGYYHSQYFQTRCCELLRESNGDTIVAELNRLVEFITSVYDLRWILTLLVTSDEAEQSHSRLLFRACKHIVHRNFVVSNDEFLYFENVLHHCKVNKLLKRDARKYLILHAQQANTQVAPWVQNVMHQVYNNSWRLDAHARCLQIVRKGFKDLHHTMMADRKAIVGIQSRLTELNNQVLAGMKRLSKAEERVDAVEHQVNQNTKDVTAVAEHLNKFINAYAAQQDQEKRNKKIKKVCRVVASIVGFVFAPVISELADCAVDAASPIWDFVDSIEVLGSIYGIHREHDIAAFLADQSNKALPDLLQSQLEKHFIPKDQFEALLRQEIVLQHPEYVEKCKRRGWDVSWYAVDNEDLAALMESDDDELKRVLHELDFALPNVEHADNRVVGNPAKRTSTSPQLQLQDLEEVQPSPMPNEPHTVLRGSSNSVKQAGSTLKARPDPKIESKTSLTLHDAVTKSQGDIEAFKQTIHDSKGDPEVKRTVQVTTQIKMWESLCAAEYAYRVGYTAIGDFLLLKLPENERAVDKSAALDVKFVESTRELTYIRCVDQSKGDLERYMRMERYASGQTFPVEAKFQAVVTYERTETMTVSAVEYACQLGYLDLVDYMLGNVCHDLRGWAKVSILGHAETRRDYLAAVHRRSRRADSH